jgi:hypothetical protein
VIAQVIVVFVAALAAGVGVGLAVGGLRLTVAVAFVMLSIAAPGIRTILRMAVTTDGHGVRVFNSPYQLSGNKKPGPNEHFIPWPEVRAFDLLQCEDGRGPYTAILTKRDLTTLELDAISGPRLTLGSHRAWAEQAVEDLRHDLRARGSAGRAATASVSG